MAEGDDDGSLLGLFEGDPVGLEEGERLGALVGCVNDKESWVFDGIVRNSITRVPDMFRYATNGKLTSIVGLDEGDADGLFEGDWLGLAVGFV